LIRRFFWPQLPAVGARSFTSKEVRAKIPRQSDTQQEARRATNPSP
jgi:hypothetical protein